VNYDLVKIVDHGFKHYIKMSVGDCFYEQLWKDATSPMARDIMSHYEEFRYNEL